MSELQNQKVLVLGLGLSGIAMARWCARNGASVTVADTRSEPPELSNLEEMVPDACFVGGALDVSLHAHGPFDRILKSPGLSPAEVSRVLPVEATASVFFAGELDLFSEALNDLLKVRNYKPKVLAITGTNGKTTVTSLTGKIVERAGKTVAVAGNIGPTLLEVLMACLDTDTLPQVWVLELSSFQLDGVKNFNPDAATVLNISEDHLDWHGDMQHYVAAKTRIFGAAAKRILNRDDPVTLAMKPPDRSPGKQTDRPAPRCQSFGQGLPTYPGDFGLESVNGMVWLVRALDADVQRRKRNEALEEVHIQRLLPADALRIRGRHNALNALAALALGEAAGCSLAPMLFALRDYRGEPHRVESVGRVHDIEFFDDSKGTNVGATVAAICGLGADRKLIVILGGVGKGQNFSPLAKPVADHARAVVLLGRDAGLIAHSLEPAAIPVFYANSMADAVNQSLSQARPGDAVLMSPACASFDMFKNYVDRAQVFRQAVEAVASETGNSLEGAL